MTSSSSNRDVAAGRSVAVEHLARQAREASRAVARLSTESKNAVLMDLAARLEQDAAVILKANERDVAAAGAAGLPEARLQRLCLTAASVRQMAEGVRQVAALDDPVGQVTRQYQAANGLSVAKVRCPLGVVMMIYEARPNVTIDAFALCFKAGNACILKGGREAIESNRALGSLAWAALEANGVAREALSLLAASDRDEMKALLRLDAYIDLVIPRGGVELLRFVHEHSRIPMVQHFQGVCHIFVDVSADLDRAVDICTSAKASAPATCNAVEAVLVHEQIAAAFVPKLAARLKAEGVELRGDSVVCGLAPKAIAAREDDWGREFLELVLACKVVGDVDAAIAHIRRYGSNHTEAILSNDPTSQQRFLDEVQASCTLVNASTRFNDGFQLGLGAEIGISTSKVHAYGPMGLEELTSQRYVVRGNWQSR